MRRKMDLQEIAAGIGSSDALRDAAAKAGISPEQAQATLHGVLEQVTGGGSLEGMVEGLAAKAGVDPSNVQAFLPSIMGLLRGHADNAEEGVQAALGGLLGSLQNSPAGGLLSGLDANHDGSLVDDAMGLVKGLFGKKDS
jgi:hypothetical protein